MHRTRQNVTNNPKSQHWNCPDEDGIYFSMGSESQEEIRINPGRQTIKLTFMAIFVTFCAVSDNKSHRAKGLSQTVTPRLSVFHLNSTTLSEPLQTGLQRRGLQRRRPLRRAPRTDNTQFISGSEKLCWKRE